MLVLSRFCENHEKKFPTRGDFGDYADANILFGKKASVPCVSCDLLKIEGGTVKFELGRKNGHLSRDQGTGQQKGGQGAKYSLNTSMNLKEISLLLPNSPLI